MAGGRDPRTRRYPCPWCDEPDWPDLCREVFPEEEDRAYDVIIGGKCFEGDHRRCVADRCPVAADCYEEVRRVGLAAARAAGTVWAVVSILEDEPTVVGCIDHLGRAKSLLRTGHAKRWGIAAGDPRAKGVVYVVRESDGHLL